MCSGLVIFLFVSIAKAHAKDELGTVSWEARNSLVDRLLDHMVDKVFDHEHLRQADVDGTTLGKPALTLRASAIHSPLRRSFRYPMSSSQARFRLAPNPPSGFVVHGLADSKKLAEERIKTHAFNLQGPGSSSRILNIFEKEELAGGLVAGILGILGLDGAVGLGWAALGWLGWFAAARSTGLSAPKGPAMEVVTTPPSLGDLAAAFATMPPSFDFQSFTYSPPTAAPVVEVTPSPTFATAPPPPVPAATVAVTPAPSIVEAADPTAVMKKDLKAMGISHSSISKDWFLKTLATMPVDKFKPTAKPSEKSTKVSAMRQDLETLGIPSSSLSKDWFLKELADAPLGEIAKITPPPPTEAPIPQVSREERAVVYPILKQELEAVGSSTIFQKGEFMHIMDVDGTSRDEPGSTPEVVQSNDFDPLDLQKSK